MLHKLDQILAKEIITLTFIITAGLSSIMMMSQLPRYLEFVFQAPDIGTTFLMLLLFILPTILKFAVPVSLLLACAIVIMRMSSDRELEVWFASGVSIFRLSFMPTLLGFAVAIISMTSALFFEPYSSQQFEKFKWLQTRTLLESVLKKTLKEKIFIYDFPLPENIKFSVYSNQVSQTDGRLSGLFLATSKSDQIYSSFITTESGQLNRIMTKGYPDYVFSLFHGTSYAYLPQNPSPHQNKETSYPAVSNWSVTSFDQMDLYLVNAFKDKFKLQSKQEIQIQGLYPSALIQVLEKQKKESKNWKKDENLILKYLFFFKQISVPISTLFLPALGVCFGILDPRKKQFSVYFGIGAIIFVLYASLSVCQQLATQFLISPYSILFVTPSLLILITSLCLYWRYFYPPSVGFFSFIKNILWKRS